ncbi:DUF4931 domain-containing protein [Candidatus Micrarchaeota archaeon]|nr:DUF4931 domain-containing protein [Candidatus Micrarchaeota archaeon]
MVQEFRKEQTKNMVVLVASGRSKRPRVFGKKAACPFCRGAEHTTPPTTFALPNPAQWNVRAFRNAFGLVSPQTYRPFRNGRAPAYGEHEVIVENDEHGRYFPSFSSQELARVYEAYAHRYHALKKRKHVKHVLLFKNHGRKAGASIEHEHAQIISLPFVPQLVENETRHAGHLIRKIKEEKQNVVFENDWAYVWCPSFSRFSYEMWIVPKKNVPSLMDYAERESRVLMKTLQQCIRKLETISDSYNVLFFESPKRTPLQAHVELFPRRSDWAGLELGGGIIVNSKEPREAARELRRL